MFVSDITYIDSVKLVSMSVSLTTDMHYAD